MTNPDSMRKLARLRALRDGGEGALTPACPGDDVIAALAEGSAEADVRGAGLRHLAQCERCRRAVASVARALADPSVAQEVRAAERGWRTRISPIRVALAIGAAAAVLLLVLPPRLEEPLPHRAPPITASPAPEAVWPVGSIAEASSLRWTPVAGADLYRVTLFNPDGSVRYEIQQTTTVTQLPDSVRLVPGQRYGWTVDARLGFDRWASSGLIEFSVRGNQR
jgi:hypothetical protein